MKKRYSAMAFLLAASLVVPATAQAAGPGVSIYWDRSKDSAQIYLTGLTDNITGAELSLTSKQDLSQVAFSAGKDIAYAYAAKENGGMTIYVDSIAPFDTQDGQIYIGDLSVSDNVSFSGISSLITVDDKDASAVYKDVPLRSSESDADVPGDDNGTPEIPGEEEDDSNSDGSNSGGGSSSSGGSSSGNASASTGRPAVTADKTKGSITYLSNGSISIVPKDGYRIEDVLLNGISMGALSHLDNLKSTDTVQVIFAAVKEPAVETPSSSFADVPGSQWYASAVSYVTQKGLFSGVSATEFAPMDSMTRGMLVSVLYRMDGADYKGINPFTDVAAGAWYEKAVGWAYANSVVSGVSATTFAPNTPITREDAAVMLTRYLKNRGISLEESAASFADHSTISPYAKGSVAAMQKVGLLSGDENGNFRPKAQITRAEIASIFMRMCQKYSL